MRRDYAMLRIVEDEVLLRPARFNLATRNPFLALPLQVLLLADISLATHVVLHDLLCLWYTLLLRLLFELVRVVHEQGYDIGVHAPGSLGGHFP